MSAVVDTAALHTHAALLGISLQTLLFHYESNQRLYWTHSKWVRCWRSCGTSPATPLAWVELCPFLHLCSSPYHVEAVELAVGKVQAFLMRLPMKSVPAWWEVPGKGWWQDRSSNSAARQPRGKVPSGPATFKLARCAHAALSQLITCDSPAFT